MIIEETHQDRKERMRLEREGEVFSKLKNKNTTLIWGLCIAFPVAMYLVSYSDHWLIAAALSIWGLFALMAIS